MPVIHREAGWSFVIYPEDHPPPHVHAKRPGGDVKVSLLGPDGDPRVIRIRNVSDRDAWRAQAIVYEYQDAFLEHWRLIHG
jgi:hypothetical protein